MTADIVVKVRPGKFLSGGEYKSRYTDRWAKTKEELLESFQKWNGAEIISFEIVEEE